MEAFVFFVVLPLVLFPFVAPIVALVRASGAAKKLSALERDLSDHRFAHYDLGQRLTALTERLDRLERAQSGATPAPAPAPAPIAAPAPAPTPIAAPPPAPIPIAAPPPAPIPIAAPPPEVPPIVAVAPPPVPAPRSAPPPPAPVPPAIGIDWERWLGVRGAAVLGAVVLALAALLFFKYSIEHGLISPTMRVVTGTLVGIGCIVASERMRDRYEVTANALAGGGAVVLYSAFWAAKALYELIGMEAAFGLMGLTTAACCLLAVRHGSLVIALLGLAGGFTTPLVLASGQDRPIGLFGYILILDAGFLFVAHRRRWAAVASLALLGTVLMQALWVSAHMGPERLLLGLGIIAVFAVVFAVSGAKPPAEDRSLWFTTQAAAVLMPYAFAFYFAGNDKFGPHFYPVAVLAAMLGAGANWLARASKKDVRWLPIGAAAATVAVVATWLPLSLDAGPALHWEASACVVGLALAFHLFVEIDPEQPASSGPAVATLIVNVTGLALLAFGGAWADDTSFAPWFAGWIALAALLYRHAGFAGAHRPALQIVAAGGLGLALSAFHLSHATHDGFPPLGRYVAVEIAVLVALQIAALARRRLPTGRAADHGAALGALAVLFGLLFLPVHEAEPTTAWFGGTLTFALLVAFAAARLGEGSWLCAALFVVALVDTRWTTLAGPLPASTARIALGGSGAAVALFAFWPLAIRRRFAGNRWAWYASALAGPALFVAMREQYDAAFGDAAIGLLPIALGAVALACLAAVRDLWPAGTAQRLTAYVWFSAVALGFVSVAIPLQLEKQWITIGWAIEGVAVLALWQRLDHAGLKWLGVGLGVAAAVRLVGNPWLFEYHDRGPLPIVNWVLYTYWVPTVTLLGSFAVLRRLELDRARTWEAPVYAKDRAAGAITMAMCAITVVAFWINLAIEDWFATGRTLALHFERDPAVDLTRSIAYALYAVVLLAIGMARRSRALRWVSLFFLLGTISKVFLYDLGNLRDLYRVMSLLALAVSLIAVSLAYQRFVFRKEEKA